MAAMRALRTRDCPFILTGQIGSQYDNRSRAEAYPQLKGTEHVLERVEGE